MQKVRKEKFLTFLLSCAILLGVHGGRVAVWLGDDPQPKKVFPCPVSVLPDDQRRALEQGIRVESIQQLEQMLEAYLS